MAGRPHELTPAWGPPDIELRQLKILVAVAEAGSVTAAAAVLGTTPAKLASRLQRLERMAGAALLADGPDGGLFTETGELLLEHAAVVVPQFDRMLAAAAAGPGYDRIRIAAVASPVLPGLVRELTALDPAAELSVRILDPGAEPAEALLGRELDLALVRCPAGHEPAPVPAGEPGLAGTAVAAEPLLVGIPHGHPLGVPDLLTPAALSGYRCVLLDQAAQPLTRAVLAAFTDSGADPRLSYASTEWAALCLGHGAGILTLTTPPTTPMPDTAYRPLQCAATVSTLALVWSPDGPLAACLPRVRDATARAHAECLTALLGRGR
ncbi:LysR family transcriptional regulator [Amycolatopsis sp. PS_44_ISF1]|uniref:LysR family transcriptional regulator n=1 Tax=Amycolatopsis sp. PS_44_ISF1 TaxID=2974917 RepID=UPI0028DF6999|nr:LysR family transcriptional regulator [Amycolatopsis sp. PS_44_ISF1]MDT8914759.1 LysR family transcriptional regulator [Amycolatopsis sp. PS_44_ISF1]